MGGLEQHPAGEDPPSPLVRPYTASMPPRGLPPLAPLATLLFDGGGDEIRHAVTDLERPPRHRRPGPALTGPGLPPPR